MAFTIPAGVLNQIPSFDGQICLYSHSPKYADRLLIYVNGMHTGKFTFQWQSLKLSELAFSEVVAIYNESASYLANGTDIPDWMGFGVDVRQCVNDYTDILKAAIGLPMYMWLDNPATYSLYRLLATFGSYWPTQNICIVSYSQGNLITSGALFALQQKMRPTKPIIVYALASPTHCWPGGVGVLCYTNPGDFVPLLSQGSSYFYDVSDHTAVMKAAGVELGSHEFEAQAYKPKFVMDLRRGLGFTGFDLIASCLPAEIKGERVH
ncbi:MAG: hypothetical protein JNL98_14675 [Bryobacterales bacterium]|nr:hypothetical protein [Bryobacterales bacterium]